MSDKEVLLEGVNDYFKGDYEITSGYVIPNVNDIAFGKVGRELELAMLFIDIRESTKIVDGFRRTTAAKMYKSFLWGITKIAKLNGGELRSFNGDGVLVAFCGDRKCNNAAKAAMQMSWFCIDVLKPKIESYFAANSQLEDMDFNFGIGVDCGDVLVVRGGIKGENNNDLVWVGNATNYAVKLSSVKDDGYRIYISDSVFKKLNDAQKYQDKDCAINMWEKRSWNDLSIYRTKYHWSIS